MAESELTEFQRKISFANETPMITWFGSLRLGMKRGEYDFSRVKNGMVPYLDSHESRIQLGKVSKAWIVDKTAFAIVDFISDDDEALKVMKRMDDGYRKGQSPGVAYAAGGLKEIEEESDRENYIWAVRATDWELIEISSTTIPANPTVGAFQIFMDVSSEKYLQNFTHKFRIQTPKEGKTMPDVEVLQKELEEARKGKAVAEALAEERKFQLSSATVLAPVVSPPEPENTANLLSVEDREAILRLGMVTSEHELAMTAVAENTPYSEFAEKLKSIQFVTKPQKWAAADVDGKYFRISRVLRHMVFPGKREFEHEAAYDLQSVQDYRTKHDAGDQPVPAGDVFNSQAPQMEIPAHLIMGGPSPEQLEAIRSGEFAFTTTLADNAIQTTVHREQAYPWLVAQTPILQHCRLFPGLTGNESVPVASGTGHVATASADEGVTEADVTGVIGEVTLQPKTLRADVEINRLAIIQTAYWVDDFVRTDMGFQFMSAITNGICQGKGTGGEPTGVWKNTDVTAKTYDANELAFEHFVNMETTLDLANIPDRGSRIYLISNLMKGFTQTLKKDPGSGRFVIEFDEPNPKIGEYPFVKTNQLPNPNSGVGVAVFGDFMDLFVGLWEGFLVSINALTNPARPKITGLQFYDVAIPRGSHFVKLNQKA